MNIMKSSQKKTNEFSEKKLMNLSKIGNVALLQIYMDNTMKP